MNIVRWFFCASNCRPIQITWQIAHLAGDLKYKVGLYVVVIFTPKRPFCISPPSRYNALMLELFSDSLSHWNNFYFMTGGAAATLIGLIFVAVSLGANLVSPERQADIDTFVTPILFYFISVLAIACVMLVPAFSAVSLAGLLLVIGAYGLVRMGQVVGQMIRAKQRATVSWSHWFWHAILPLFSYGLIFGAALGLFRGIAAMGLLGLAAATALLLVSGIWRAWELVLWIARQREGD